MDPRKMLQMKSALAQLNKNHPKLWPFIQSLEQEGLAVDSVIEITVTTPEGKRKTANIKVKESDLELIRRIKK